MVLRLREKERSGLVEPQAFMGTSCSNNHFTRQQSRGGSVRGPEPLVMACSHTRFLLQIRCSVFQPSAFILHLTRLYLQYFMEESQSLR